MGPWRKARRQDWERSPGAWTPNAASCATGEGSQGNAGGRTEGERKEREGESREEEWFFAYYSLSCREEERVNLP